MKVQEISNYLTPTKQVNKRLAYIEISNNDNKIWLIPLEKMKLGLLIYQPSSLKGILIKKLLPLIVYIPFLRKLSVIQMKYLKISSHLETLLSSVFSNEKYYISVFSGTPGNHRKVTLQIYNNDKILGYCKISKNPEIKELFWKESKTLLKLKKLGVNNIPDCLYNGKIDLINEDYIFIQSTQKNKSSRYSQQLLDLHYDFVTQLMQRTSEKMFYESSNFQKSINLLKSEEVQFKFLHSKNDWDVIQKSINIVEEYLIKMKYFYFYHHDFTPWNMCISSSLKKPYLYVFDFEYSEFGYPPFLDIFHYFTQTCIFHHQIDAKQIYRKYKESGISTEVEKRLAFINDEIFNSNSIYMCYLLDILSFYLHRDKDIQVEDNPIFIWTKLLRYLLKELDN